MRLELWQPPCPYAFKGDAIDDGEGDNEDVCSRVAQDAHMGEFILARCIPKAKIDWHAVDDHSGHVVLKDGRNIILREAVVGVRDEQARLSNSAVADEDTSDA